MLPSAIATASRLAAIYDRNLIPSQFLEGAILGRQTGAVWQEAPLSSAAVVAVCRIWDDLTGRGRVGRGGGSTEVQKEQVWKKPTWFSSLEICHDIMTLIFLIFDNREVIQTCQMFFSFSSNNRCCWGCQEPCWAKLWSNDAYTRQGLVAKAGEAAAFEATLVPISLLNESSSSTCKRHLV